MTTLPVDVTSDGLGSRVRAVGERHPMGLVTFGVVVFSTGPVLVAGTDVSGPIFSFWRLWFGALGLAVLTVLHIRLSGVRPSWTGIRWALLSGVAFGLHQLLFMTALKETSLVDVTLMNTLAPICVQHVSQIWQPRGLKARKPAPVRNACSRCFAPARAASGAPFQSQRWHRNSSRSSAPQRGQTSRVPAGSMCDSIGPLVVVG